MSNENWAIVEAQRVLNSEGFRHRETREETIAAALQAVADECAEIADTRRGASAEIRARFSKEEE